MPFDDRIGGSRSPGARLPSASAPGPGCCRRPLVMDRWPTARSSSLIAPSMSPSSWSATPSCRCAAASRGSSAVALCKRLDRAGQVSLLTLDQPEIVMRLGVRRTQGNGALERHGAPLRSAWSTRGWRRGGIARRPVWDRRQPPAEIPRSRRRSIPGDRGRIQGDRALWPTWRRVSAQLDTPSRRRAGPAASRAGYPGRSCAVAEFGSRLSTSSNT